MSERSEMPATGCVPEAVSSLKGRGFHTPILYFCFFISGVAGLIYEVLWARYLALCVGSTGLAQIIVLATFMGGLALGSHLLGSTADRVRSPLKLYVILEIAIGLYALVFHVMFLVSRHVFVDVARLTGLTTGGLVLGKVLISILLIFLPTFLMGGTLPALGRHMVRTVENIGPRISRLYFLNSFGAVAGCLLAGFYLIEAVGLKSSMITGAALNFLAAGAALLVFAREQKAALPARQKQESEKEPGELLSRGAITILITAVFISGAVAMTYEVAWIRLLAQVLGSSTYAFSLMLATFILGLAIGSFLLSLRKKTTGYTKIFALTEFGVGLTVLLTLPFYVRLPYWFNQLSSSLSREEATFGLYQLCTFLFCAMVMIVPTILQGVTLPAAIKAVTPNVRRLGHRIGFVYAVNTVGTLLGSIGAGILGLPFLGIRGTIELAVAINMILGIAILVADKPDLWRGRLLKATGVAAVAVWIWYGFSMGPWDKQVLSSGPYRMRERKPSYKAFVDEANLRMTRFYRDGVDATIAVQDFDPQGNNRCLLINGKMDASTLLDLPTQKLLAHLPLLFSPPPKKVLVIGIGSGSSIGSVLAYNEVEKVDVVEISRDVIEASRFFERVNGKYWDDPRVHIHWEDAKTFLQVTDDTYDVIISEPSNPWIAGIAGVFSREYFETCRQHLAPGGYFSQWAHFYEMEDKTFFTILETFTDVFPCYTLWSPHQKDIVFLGSPVPYAPDFECMLERISAPTVLADLRLINISSPLTLLAVQMADHASRPSHIAWRGTTHSDFHPILDFSAQRGFFIGKSAQSVLLLDERLQSPANSRLWLQAFLQEGYGGREDFQDCFNFMVNCMPDAKSYPLLWVREWIKRYPDDPQAWIAYGNMAVPTNEGLRHVMDATSARANRYQEIRAERVRCRLAYLDYIATRNYLSFGTAEEVLARIKTFFTANPDVQDPEMLLWRGQLEFDLGRYNDAEKRLSAASDLLQLVGEREAVREAVLDTNILLCEALLKQEKVDRAKTIWNKILIPYSSDYRVWMLGARIEAATRNLESHETVSESSQSGI